MRDSDDLIEREGVKRAKQMIETADRILFVVDIKDDDKTLLDTLPKDIGVTIIYNKIDNEDRQPEIIEHKKTQVYLSAKTGDGINLLKQHLKNCMGYQQKTEGQFIARRRHLDAINNAEKHLKNADKNLHQLKAGELLAEELRLAQLALSSITGEFSSDDLLGRIFSDFCIGK